MHQLIPGAKLPAADTYRGPVSMLRRAFEATESLGSLTVVLAVMARSICFRKTVIRFFGLIRSIFISVFLCLLSLSLPAQRCLLKDNSTRIHGKLHPMIAIITVGDCELLVLRRVTRAVSCAGRFEHDLRFTSKLQF